MGDSLTVKIIRDHLVSGEMVAGSEIGLRIDQTLTQDATGTMAYLQWETLGLPKVLTDLSVSYADHNMLQTDFRNADDHRYLQSIAAKYGIRFSRPGNGICHQVHLERFGIPGTTLLGSDSHTPTGGGLGQLAMGAGGLDVAVAMAGAPFYVPMPRVAQVYLTGALSSWVAAKDVILELLRRLSVKGGVGQVMEYSGPGVTALTIPQRATISNMGTELGATTSIFPSDESTRAFLKAQDREDQWQPMAADADAVYDQVIELDLSSIEPLIAQPHSPDAVVSVSEIAGKAVNQVCIGSCTNSSVVDLETVAAMLKDKTVHPTVSLVVSPGSKQALTMIAESGALAMLVAAGARILDAGCGPCIGMGQAPISGGISVRSFNRNFLGRSGTADGQVYLASVEVCAATALTGVITDPRELGTAPVIAVPDEFLVNDNMLIEPPADGSNIEILRGPNIKPLPTRGPLEQSISAPVLLVTGDNITTDHIMPAGATVLPFRSNVPALSDFVFVRVDPTFPKRARQAGQSIIIGGENYGQGSSREHAALVPMYLGVQAVLVKSFARIHMANLVNVGILPLLFDDSDDYARFAQDDQIEISNAREAITKGRPIIVKNVTKGLTIQTRYELSRRQVEVMLAGGLLNYIKTQA